MRAVIAIIEIDDGKAIAEDLGTIDYLSREFDRLADNGIFLEDAKILDNDDECDIKAIELANTIFSL